MRPILLLGLVGGAGLLALALGGSAPSKKRGSLAPAVLLPLPTFNGPPKNGLDAGYRIAALTKVRPDASTGSSDWYRSRTYYLRTDTPDGIWQETQGDGPFTIFVDEYGRYIKGEKGNPLGTLLQAAGIAAPFIPGVGPVAAAGLAAAIAWAKGESMQDAVLAAARAAIPGGELAAMGFDAGVAILSGKSVDDAALDAFLKQYPEAQTGYNTAKDLLRG